MNNNIQAILFDKNKWNTLTARRWIKDHGYQPIKRVHTTDKFYRYRLRDPDPTDKYISKKLKNNIQLIIII